MTDIPISSDLLDKWQNIVELMAEVIEVPSAIITRIELPHGEVVRASRTEGNPYEAGMSANVTNHYCEEVVRTKQPVRVSDARKSPRWQNAPEIDHGMVSYMGYPIRWPGGEIFGTICVLDRKENPYDARHERLMEQFREVVESHLAVTAQNRRLQAQLDEIRRLRRIIPICAKCKHVRDDDGYWQQVEDYLALHSDLVFSHGLCPECAGEMFPDVHGPKGKARSARPGLA